MERTIPKKNSYLTPCLPLEASDKEDKKEESDYVTLTVKVRAGQTGTSAPSYKMKVAKFEDGTPTKWIDVMNALEEICKQNSLTQASDRQASVKTILREDALTAFEASFDEDLEPEKDADERTPEKGLTPTMIDDALISVAKNICPHRALEIQKIWMRRQIRKLKDMPVRKLAAIITKMNNSLARFPEADENDRFEQGELLEIIEWALPYEWRAKFDLKSYVPSDYDKKHLIAEAEAIERAESMKDGKPKAQESKEKKSSKSRKDKKVNPNNSKSSSTEYFCTEHGAIIRPMERLIVSPSRTEMVNNNQTSQRTIVLFQPRSFEKKSTS
jgi:FtsZ-interacting cell division protein YlmF